VRGLRLIVLVVLVVLVGTLVQPARAEAVDAATILAIAGIAVGVALIIAVVVIANVREKQGGLASEPLVIASDAGVLQSI
jgi:hypothetical protein